jgi:hypothetical protein
MLEAFYLTALEVAGKTFRLRPDGLNLAKANPVANQRSSQYLDDKTINLGSLAHTTLPRCQCTKRKNKQS